jgi:hypothetical protein
LIPQTCIQIKDHQLWIINAEPTGASVGLCDAERGKNSEKKKVMSVVRRSLSFPPTPTSVAASVMASRVVEMEKLFLKREDAARTPVRTKVAVLMVKDEVCVVVGSNQPKVLL